MKLLRFGELGSEKPGILDSEGKIRDLFYNSGYKSKYDKRSHF